MAAPAEVIEKLALRGIKLQPVADGNLKVVGSEKLSANETDILRQHKPVLIRELKIQALPETIATNFGVAKVTDLLAELRPWPSDLDDFLNDPKLQVAFGGACIASKTIHPVTDHDC